MKTRRGSCSPEVDGCCAPVVAEDLVGPDDELERLHGLARSGTYALLEAPRRYARPAEGRISYSAPIGAL